MNDIIEDVPEVKVHEKLDTLRVKRCLQRCESLAKGVQLDIKYDSKLSEVDSADKAGLLGLIEHCDNDTDKICEHVNIVRQLLNKWTVRVLLWDVLFVFFAILFSYAVFAFLGISTPELMYSSAYIIAATRPTLSILVIVLVALIFVSIHFTLRKRIARRLMNEVEEESGALQVASLIKRSTRAWHSILRPEPVGWHWWQQWKIKRLRNRLAVIRAELYE